MACAWLGSVLLSAGPLGHDLLAPWRLHRCSSWTRPVAQFVQFFVFPVAVQRLTPMVHTVRRTTEIPQFFFDKVIDAPVMQVAGFIGCRHPCRDAETVICLENVLFHLYCMFGSFLIFPYLLSLDRGKWPRCLLWHGWLPGLSCNGDRAPWAASFGQLACLELECRLGANQADCSGHWSPPEYWDADDVALEMSDHPNVWTDGSREDFSSVGGFEVAGAGVYLLASELAFDGSVWRTAEEYGDAGLERCRAFMPVPGVMQTVQRAEFLGAIIAMQAYRPCHLGIDNLNVAWSLHRLLDRDSFGRPLPLVKDCDLIALAQYLIRTRGRETVRVTKVKWHAEDVDVQQGRVLVLDQQENSEADAAADLGQSEVLIDARRRLLKARSHSFFYYVGFASLHDCCCPGFCQS